MKIIKNEVLSGMVEIAIRCNEVMSMAVALGENDEFYDASNPTHYVIVIPASSTHDFMGIHKVCEVTQKDFD